MRPVTGEMDVDTLEEAGWTDVHMHVADPQWSLAKEQLPQLITAFGVDAVHMLSAHASAYKWDADEEMVALFEHTDVSLDQLPALLANPSIQHLSMVIDPSRSGMLPLLALCQSNDWHPCFVFLSWGVTTLPDFHGEATMAEFQLSFAVGGPGIPEDPDAFNERVTAMPALQEARQRFADAIGAEVSVTIAFGD